MAIIYITITSIGPKTTYVSVALLFWSTITNDYHLERFPWLNVRVFTKHLRQSFMLS